MLELCGTDQPDAASKIEEQAVAAFLRELAHTPSLGLFPFWIGDGEPKLRSLSMAQSNTDPSVVG